MNIKKVLSRIFLGMCCVTGITASSVVLSACKTEVNETQEFTVTFNTLGGSSIDSVKIKDGEKVTKPTSPTRDGYTFKYWSLQQDGEEYNFDTAVTGDVTLYAVWEENQDQVEKYTVSFNTVGGNAIDSVEVEKDGKVTKPANPTKSGYTFKYWSLAQDGEEYDFNTPVTGDITLYAVWEENQDQVEKYTVTFNAVGGSEVSAIEVEKDGKVAKPADPTKDGYIFKHWSLTENGEAYDFNTPVTSNITLYAVWEEETDVPPVEETETVTRTLDLTKVPSFMTQDASNPDYYLGEGKVGFFSLWGSKLRYEVSKQAINTQGGAAKEDNSVSFTTTSEGVLTFNIKNASSSNLGLVLLDSDGNLVNK